MENTAALPRPELLQVANTVACDKGIDKEEVLTAMEFAIQKAGRSKYGQEHDIRAAISRKDGSITMARFIEIVPDDAEIDVENEEAQITYKKYLASAWHRKYPNMKVGDFIVDPFAIRSNGKRRSAPSNVRTTRSPSTPCKRP